MSNYVLENLAVCEIMWRNVSEPDWPQMKKWRMRIACWMITKATDTHSEYVILIPFPLKWFHERASVLCYTYVVCFVKPFLVLKYCINHFYCCTVHFISIYQEKPTNALILSVF
jgi:hypothetical protein